MAKANKAQDVTCFSDSFAQIIQDTSSFVLSVWAVILSDAAIFCVYEGAYAADLQGILMCVNVFCVASQSFCSCGLYCVILLIFHSLFLTAHATCTSSRREGIDLLDAQCFVYIVLCSFDKLVMFVCAAPMNNYTLCQKQAGYICTMSTHYGL